MLSGLVLCILIMRIESTIFLGFLVWIVFFASSCEKEEVQEIQETLKVYQTMTDQDGNVYRTIQIGTQVWMAENLRTAKYRNGSSIPNIYNDLLWDNTTKGAFCHYENNDTIAAAYGHLYNWFAVTDSRGLAPQGWHIPTESEWDTLAKFMGGDLVAGGNLKERGIVHWNIPNTDATNKAGFNALPCGARGEVGQFCFLGTMGFWWSSDFNNSSAAFLRGVSNNTAQFLQYSYSKEYGFSVRCVKD